MLLNATEQLENIFSGKKFKKALHLTNPFNYLTCLLFILSGVQFTY